MAASRDKLGHLFHDAVFFIRRNTKQGLTVLVAAQRQNRDQELAVLDLNSRSQASARSMIACRKPSAQSAAISALNFARLEAPRCEPVAGQ